MPTGKKLEIGPRDIEIFRLLHRFRYLRSTFIHAFVGGHPMTLKWRLRDFYHEDPYLNRPKQQRDAYNARYSPAIYELGPLGEEILREHGLLEENASDLVTRGRMGSKQRAFPHSLMICDTLASIELGVRDDPNVRFVSWEEILAKAPLETREARNPFAIPADIAYTFKRTGKLHRAKVNLVPDGLFGLEYKKPDGRTQWIFYALEAERKNRVWCHNLQQTSWLKKVLAYREIRKSKTYKTHLGLPNLMVLAVTPTRAKIDTMTKLITDVTNDRGSSMFCFRLIPTLTNDLKAPAPLPDLYVKPWKRTEHPDFYLNDPHRNKPQS